MVGFVTTLVLLCWPRLRNKKYEIISTDVGHERDGSPYNEETVDSNEQDELRIINNTGDNMHIMYLSVIAKIPLNISCMQF